MASTTKYKLAETILYKLAGGYPDTADSVQREDIYEAISNKINSLFKMEYMNVTLPSGETIPDNLQLASYDGVTVSSSGDRSKSLLPVIPISLPRNMGVFDIQDADGLASFIPLLSGQRILLKSQSLVNDLMGQVGFEVRNKEVWYTKDLTLLGIENVNMSLVVMDLSQYSDTDLLPVPASYEDQIVNDIVAQFAPVMPETGIVNSYTTADNKTKIK